MKKAAAPEVVTCRCTPNALCRAHRVAFNLKTEAVILDDANGNQIAKELRTIALRLFRALKRSEIGIQPS